MYIYIRYAFYLVAATTTPGEYKLESGSDVVLKWTFNQNISDDFEVQLLSRKNPVVLLRRNVGKIIVEDADFRDRIQLLADDGNVVALKIRNVLKTDSGFYAVNIPKQTFFNSNSSLVVKGLF